MWPQYPGLCKGPRVLPTIVWYPMAADPTYTRRPRAPYLNSRAKRRSLAKCFKMPAWLLDHMERYATRARVGATAWTPSAADGRLPVVLFSHSWTAVGAIVSAVRGACPLGFVVLAPDHCGDCPLSEFVEDVDIDVEASGSPPCRGRRPNGLYGLLERHRLVCTHVQRSHQQQRRGPSRQLASLLESMAGAFGSMSKGGLGARSRSTAPMPSAPPSSGCMPSSVPTSSSCRRHLLPARLPRAPPPGVLRRTTLALTTTLTPSPWRPPHLLSRPYIHQARYLLAMRLRWASSAYQVRALLDLAPHLDLRRVYAAGQSFGGGTAAYTCTLDARFCGCWARPMDVDIPGCCPSLSALVGSEEEAERIGSLARAAQPSLYLQQGAADRHASPRAPRVPRGAWVTPRSPR